MNCYQSVLRLRCSSLTSPAIIPPDVEGPSIDSHIPRVGKHDGHPQEC